MMRVGYELPPLLAPPPLPEEPEELEAPDELPEPPELLELDDVSDLAAPPPFELPELLELDSDELPLDFPDGFVDEYRSAYHPPPLRMKLPALICLRAVDWWHFGHTVEAGSEIF
ncbi:hypothetical protein LZC94_17610 [Pendulispora albinea]|uniref:Uncharacterized protein n=1 Tax=Pendulispora albinea TaxID=2741071 RepID=A0ABZ2M983_9BACT